jgi:hypothetical protein
VSIEYSPTAQEDIQNASQKGCIFFVEILVISHPIITPIRYFRHRYPIPLSEEEELFQDVAL